MITTKKKAFENHILFPKHQKLSDGEKEKLLSEMGINFKDLPKILRNDSMIVSDESIKTGDIIKITRKSSTAKEAIFYRGVIDA